MSETPETDALLLHEARSLAQAGYAKAERAEKMLRHAAAKADEWRECAENLIDYARECLANLSWGSGYTRYNREMDTIRKDIARYERLKEGGK
jgi:hypothetical protein